MSGWMMSATSCCLKMRTPRSTARASMRGRRAKRASTATKRCPGGASLYVLTDCIISWLCNCHPPNPLITPHPTPPPDQDTVYACIRSQGQGGTVLNTEVILNSTDQQPIGLRPPERVSFTTGLCFCHLNKLKNRIHRIQTAAGNTSTLEFIGAEVLAPSPPVTAAAALPQHPCYKQEAVPHPRARAYRVTVAAGASTGPVQWGFCGVVMVLGGKPAAAAFEGRGMRVGAAWWFEGPLTVDVKNEGTSDGEGGEPAELLVVEWTG